MGVCTFLASDSTKEFCSLGEVFLSEALLHELRAEGPRADSIQSWLTDTDGEFNHLIVEEIPAIASSIAKWMEAHPDWRFLTDADEAYDDVYLADDDEEAREYAEEFGDLGQPVYKKTGSI